MDKQDWIKYIDRINLTGPGGRDKIKKILREIAEKGGGGGGGGGGDDAPTLSKPYYFGGSNVAIPVDSNTGRIMSGLSNSDKSVVSDVPCFTKYYYIGIPVSFTLQKVLTENNENITELFISKGAYLQGSDSYVLYEFHLNSDEPLNVYMSITVVE